MKVTRHPVINGYKVCTKCGKNKPVSEYTKNRNQKSGINCCCKECARELNRKSYQKMKEEHLAQKKRKYQGSYEKHKDNARANYYNSHYLWKKYLKRYLASLEKVEEKKKRLLEEAEPGQKMAYAQKIRLHTYEDAIEQWKRKINEAEKAIAEYESDKRKAELPSKKKEQEQQPTIENNMEEQKPILMTKESLINLLADVPNYARIIYVADSGNRSNLVAAWRPDPFSVCIRNLNASMPYIITDGALYELVSATIPFPICPKKGE